jgi:hypothetical protein
MRQKIRLFPILIVLLLIAVSLAPGAAWSPAVSQEIETKRVELQPAGKDTVSLETRKQLLVAREAALMACRKAALVAREQQMNVLAVDASNRERKSIRKMLTVAHAAR